MKKTAKISLFLGVGIIALVMGLSLSKDAGAVVQVDPDPRVSSLSASPASTTAGATTTYTLSFTLSEAMAQGGRVMIVVQSNGNCDGDWNSCQVNFENVTENDVSGISNLHDFNAWDQGVELGKNSWTAGTYTVTLSGVQNPSQVGGHYRAYAETMATGEQQEPCEPGEECPQGPRTASAPIFFGTVGVKGTITLPNGDPASNVSVEVRSEDFSTNEHANTDDLGFYAVMANRLTSGTAYTLEVWVGGNEDMENYVSPELKQFTYAGSTLTKNAQLRTASKTVTGVLKYNDGTVVKTGAEVWANPMGGGGGKNAQVSETDGTFTITLAGGSYDLGLNAGWVCDGNGCHERTVNWTYNQPSQMVEFANNTSTENKTVNFVVQKTDAIVKGKILKPNGDPIGGHIELSTGDGPGMGGHVDQYSGGRFNINVMAGKYKLMFWPDTWGDNSGDNARYYMDEMVVNVSTDQTLNLGTITLKKKTSKITGSVITKDDEPVADFRVNCWVHDGYGWAEATTNTSGVYNVWIAPGEWECGASQGPDTNYIPISQGPPKFYQVKANQTITADDIVVQEADAQLTIKAIDKDGNAIASLWGGAYARKKSGGFGPGNEFHTGLDRGEGTLSLLGGSTYMVGIHIDKQTDLLMQDEIEVVVPEGAQKTVKVTLVEPDAFVRIILKDQYGKKLTDLEAEVEIGSEGFGMWRHARTQNGEATIGVQGGNKYFAGYWLRDNPEYVQTHPEGAPFLVKSGQTVTQVITVFRANAGIEITLKDPDGNLVDWGHAWCSNHRYKEDKLKTDTFSGTEGSGQIIDAGTEIREGRGQIAVVVTDDNYQYECGSGGGPDMMANNWLPPDMVEVKAKEGETTKITLQFSEADSTITGSAKLDSGSAVNWGWCFAFSQNGQHSGTELIDGKFSLPVNSGTTWFVGCDTNTSDGFYRSIEKMVSVPKEGTYSTSLILSKELWDLPEGLTLQFDASQQQSLTLPDGTTVTIPSGAFGTEGTVTLLATPNIQLYSTADTKPVTYSWNLEAMDSNNQLIESFNSSVTVCIPWDEEILAADDIDEDLVNTKYYDDNTGSWKSTTGGTKDDDNNMACFVTDHFTNFALTTGTAGIRTAGTTGNYDIAVTPLSGGGPQVVLADENGNVVANFFAYSSSLRIGVQVATADVDGDGDNEIITAPGAGAGPQVRVFDHQGQVETQFFAYGEGVRTGINVTAADVDGDGTADIITSTMSGAGPQVRVFDANGNVKSQFFAFTETFRGGVNLTTGDVDGDGTNEIVAVPASEAGPQVRVFNSDGSVVSQFFAYAETVRGGYNVNVGDIDGDGTADIVVSPKAGNGPQVAVFDGSGNVMNRFFAFAETFRGGVNASVGDVDGDGDNDIVASPESEAGPQIRVFDGNGNVLSQYWAYSSHLRGNFTSFVADLNGDGTTEIVTAPGEGMGPQVRTFDQDGNALSQFFSHHTGFRGGIYITKAL